MGRNRTVAPGSTRIPISDGDWIEVKRELNTGDSKRLEAAGNKAVLLRDPVSGVARLYNIIDWEVHDIERALIFITKWNLTGPDNVALDLNMDSMKALDQDTFNEINSAIVSHVMDGAAKKLKAAKAAKESQQEPTPPTPSPSEQSESVATLT